MRLKRAFTLIELLVVVAIIALLIAILVPSLTRTRAGAQRVLCGSSMRQWGIAAVGYSAANQGMFPNNRHDDTPVRGRDVSWNSSTVQKWWADYLLPNRGAAPKNETHDVLNCPTQVWHRFNDRVWSDSISAYIAGTGGLIGYFWLPHRSGNSLDYSYAGTGWVYKTRFGGPDQRAPLLTDMKQSNRTPESWFFSGGPYSSHVRPTGEPEGGNFLFEDGRVVWYNSDTTGTPASEDPDDIIRVGASSPNWYFYYQIPLN